MLLHELVRLLERNEMLASELLGPFASGDLAGVCCFAAEQYVTYLRQEYYELLEVLARLGLAVLLGGLVGIERQVHGRWAGLRTHMAVSIAAAMFMVAGQRVIPTDAPDLTRVIQGIATGIGFLGAGTILKLSDQLEVKGLTTASSIWLSAAVGTACGAALYGLAVAGTVTTLIVLALLRPVEKWMRGGPEEHTRS